MRQSSGISCRVARLGATSVMVSLLHLNVARAEKLDGDQLLDPDHLVEVQITLPEADWTALCRQSRNVGAVFSGAAVEDPFTYFKADISIDGEKIASVGIRKKGFIGSLDNRRPSLKVKFDEFVDQDPIKGLSRLTLNNNKQDSSQVSQFLTYRLFREAGLHAPRSNFARVTVNGEYLGIYSHVESIKKPFLKRSFGNKSGNLYEGTLTDFHPKTIGKLEAKTNEDSNDRSDIKRLAELLAAEGELPLDQLEQIIDLDYFLRFWVLESLTGFWDGYTANQNNFYLYFDPKSGKGYFIPWGADWVFTSSSPFSRFSRGPTSVYAQSILANRLYHTEGIPQRYRKTMERLLNEAWDAEEMLAAVGRMEKLIVPHLHESQWRTPESINAVRDFIRGRSEVILAELSRGPVEVPATPRKPSYTVPVGKVSGKFTATWSDQRPSDPTEAGKTDLKIELDGKVVAFERLGVTAGEQQFSRFGPGGSAGPGGDSLPPVSLTFTGRRASNGELLTLSLVVDQDAFEQKNGNAINVTGRLTVGRGGGFGRGFGGAPGRSVDGQLRLTESSITDGERVIGSVDLEIVETRGGLFSRNSEPRRVSAEDNKRREERRKRIRHAVALMNRYDADEDGSLSRQEREGADLPENVDSNKDGIVTFRELSNSLRAD